MMFKKCERIDFVLPLLLVVISGLFAGCTTLRPTETRSPIVVSEEIPHDKIASDPLRYAAAGIEGISQNRLEEASQEFNRALKLEPNNSWLQFLNGLTYHLRALQGDGSQYELAAQGYELAIKFDRSNWIARYHLGLLHLDRKDFEAAQEQFAEVILFNSHDPDIFYNMIVASYNAKDPSTAAAVLAQLRELEPDSERMMRASAMVMAAIDHPEEARTYLKSYQDLIQDVGAAASLSARLQDWETFYSHYEMKDEEQTTEVNFSQGRGDGWLNSAESLDEVESDSNMVEDDQEDLEESESLEGEADEDDENRMIIVDVVIIGTEEDITTRKGINLLNGLSVQFGDSENPGYSRGYNRTRAYDYINGTYTSTKTKTITRLISVPALTYSLNIFNSNTERNEILARPTLVALNGEESKFFSGVNITAATVGDGGSDSSSGSVEVNADVGVTLNVTPEFLDDHRVKLNVHAERTFLKTPSDDVIYENKIETSQVTLDANVVMHPGETLILSGLSEKETERRRDGVPFLQDLPLIQYVFSRKDTKDYQRSVLILITPREPQYVYSNNSKLTDGADKSGKRRRALTELQARYSDWFKPYPVSASVFHHLQFNSLYREFRTSDVSLERWENQQTLRDRLRQALGFLYY